MYHRCTRPRLVFFFFFQLPSVFYLAYRFQLNNDCGCYENQNDIHAIKIAKKNEQKKLDSKKKRTGVHNFSLAAHNLTNRTHIQLHLPEEICYLSCSSKCFRLLCFFFLFFCRTFRFNTILFFLRFFLCTDLSHYVCFALCLRIALRSFSFYIFIVSFGVLMIMFAETSSVLCALCV